MKVVVVGGGIAGLGAATEFSKRGHEVKILEAEDRVGGRAMLLRRHGSEDRCDVGTQYYHSSYKRALGLIGDVGLSGNLSKISGQTRFFDDRVSGGSFLMDHRVPWMKPGGVKGNLRAAAFLVHRLIRHRMRTFELEDRPYLDQTPAFEVIKDPFLREFIVRALVLVGGLSEPEPTNVSLLQVLRLIRIILLSDYVSLSGGVSSLHEALGERLDVRLETPGEQLVVENEEVKGVALASGEVVRADHVVVATTAPRAAMLLPPEWSTERRFLSDVTLPPALIVSFFLDRPLEKGVWSYYLPASHKGAVSFCSDAAEKNPVMVPSGKAVLQAWICYPSSAQWIKEPDSDVVDVCRRELEERFPHFSSWVEDAVVTRHAMGVPWHPAGHHTKALRFLESADGRKGISFCGDYLSGGYLEPALWTAERAAERAG